MTTQPTSHTANDVVFKLENVAVAFDGKKAVKEVSYDVRRGRVTSMIGPSGSGKTTLLRSLNRLHENTPGCEVTGTILLEGQDIYGADTSFIELRTKVGMIFQRPKPFLAMTIYENVVSGLRFNGIKKKSILDDAAEEALRAAALWERVEPRLSERANSLSGGEQQRLCIARALAMRPEVLLMDEPTAALDPIATAKIEELIRSICSITTVIIVTHNMQQAARVSDDCAFLLMDEDRAGKLIEFAPTQKIFNNPDDERTLDYINGRFG